MPARPVADKRREEKSPWYAKPLVQSSLLAPGAALAGKGVYDVTHIPKELAFTYGTEPWMGAGHRAPSEALAEVLRRDPEFKKYTITQMGIPAGKHGDKWQMPEEWKKRKLLGIVDTGFGAGHPEVAGDVPKGTPRLSFLTDWPSTSENLRELQTFRHPQHPDRGVIYYGDPSVAPSRFGEPGTHGVERQGPLHHVGDVSPAFHPDVRELVTGSQTSHQVTLPHRHEYERLLTSLTDAKGNPLTRDGVNPLITPDMLRGKKIVAISGSGRGDFVGERAKQLAEHLKATGRNDVLIIGAAAGGAEDAAKLTQGLDNVVILPSMPRKKFVDVLRGSDLHYGSSGASSFAESMMSGNRFVLPRSWSEVEDQIANPMRRQHGLHPLEGSWSKKWLDKVNAGQLQHAQGRGVPLIDPTKPEELLKVLDDPAHSHAAMGRAQRYLRELDLAQPRFKQMMKDFLGRAENAHKAKAIMTIASSLPFIAAGGYGLYKYIRSGEKMKKSAAKEEKQKPDPIGTAASGAGIAGLAATPMLADFSPEARFGKDMLKYTRQGVEHPPFIQQVGNVLKSHRNKAALISALLGTGALGYGLLRKPERTKTAAFLIRSAMYNESVRR